LWSTDDEFNNPGKKEPVMSMLPVVIVDDEIDSINATANSIRNRWANRDIATYLDLDEAGEALIERKEPFILLLDHDFKGRSDDFKGEMLARVLRRRHPWGLILPICYLSGRFDDKEWRDLTEENAHLAPTSYVRKGTRNIADLVEHLEMLFLAAQASWQEQQMLAVVDADDDLWSEAALDSEGSSA